MYSGNIFEENTRYGQGNLNEHMSLLAEINKFEKYNVLLSKDKFQNGTVEAPVPGQTTNKDNN